jgi:hypothetical protein
MKKVVILAVAAASYLVAGADIEPLVDYEQQDVQEAVVEEVKEVKPAPVPVPVVTPAPVPAPAPVPVVAPKAKNMYVGLDALCGRFETSSGACSCLGDVVAKLGYNFNKYIAVEGRLGYGVTEADHDGGGDSKIKENYGLYLKPQLPLGDKVALFGLLGYAKAKVESTGGEVGSLVGTIDEASPSFGLGLEFNVNDRWSVVAEGVRLLHGAENTYNVLGGGTKFEDDVNLDTYGLGVNYKF